MIFINRISISILCVLVTSHVWAASAGGIPAATVFSQISNLGLLIAILYFTQRKTISKMFADKKEQFLENVNAASKSKEDAEKKLQEVKLRVEKLVSTFDSQVEEAKTNAEEAYRVQIADAKNEAIRLKSSARSSLEFEVQREIENLRLETFQRSSEIAEKNLEKDMTSEQLKAWNTHFASAKEGAH